MNIRNHLEYRATTSLLGLCRILPEKQVYALFESIAKLMYHLLGSRRRLTLRNLEIAFPEKTLKERQLLAKRCFANLADSMAFNTLVGNGRITNEMLDERVEIIGWENLEQARTSTDMGPLAYTAHIGNWELMPQYAALRLDAPVHVIARKSTNPLLEEKIVLPQRERFGVRVFYKRNALTRILKAVKKGGIAGILIDQRLNLKQGIAVEFFGCKAGTTATPALLQIRFGVPTIPAFMVKVDRGRYRLIFGKPTEWADNGKPIDEQVHELTCRHQKVIEDIIREYPDQWFWVHNRWGLSKAER
jgi:KDO2-lipid IV(A) lauroyltransferase